MKLTAVLFGVAFVVATVCAKPEDSPINAAGAPEDVIINPAKSPAVVPSASTAMPTKPPVTTSTTPTPPPTTPTPPPTTTQPPTTPTTQPTTPPPTTPSTHPTSTPTPAPPSPKPTPKPVPKEYYWNVTDDKGAICILAKADITLKLTYTNETAPGKKEQITNEIKISPNATSSGICDKENQVLQLTSDKTTISFNFQRNETGDYHLSRISSNITLDKGLGNQSYILLASDDLKVFRTKLNTSYECRWSEPAVLKEVDQYVNITKATLRINMDNIRFEAFRDMPGDNFAEAYSCEMDNTDLVPIMVGIALGILVAVVLIAYLVGRRSTQAQGYLSM